MEEAPLVGVIEDLIPPLLPVLDDNEAVRVLHDVVKESPLELLQINLLNRGPGLLEVLRLEELQEADPPRRIGIDEVGLVVPHQFGEIVLHVTMPDSMISDVRDLSHRVSFLPVSRFGLENRGRPAPAFEFHESRPDPPDHGRAAKFADDRIVALGDGADRLEYLTALRA